MISINESKLQEVITGYKKYFPEKIQYEIYKWKAVKRFQDTWDINATDFRKMFEKATALHDNLLTSRNHFPRGVLFDFCNAEPETVRQMFRELFDETKSLTSRINKFTAESIRLQEKYLPGKMHYQDMNAISIYLWSMYPDKYYIYKFKDLKATADYLESSHLFKMGGGAEGYVYAIDFFNSVRSVLQKDPEIRTMLDAALTSDCYRDDKLNCVVIDIHYYTSRFFLKGKSAHTSNSIHYWMYSPGEYARMWDDCTNKGIMCLGWDKIGDFKQYNDREQMRKKMPSIWGPNSTYMNDSLATWQFANEIQIGDVVFAKKGLTHIIGRGIVESDYMYDPSRKEYVHTRKVKWTDVGDWETNGQQAMKTLTDITKYTDYVAKLNKMIDGSKKPISGVSEPEQSGYKQYWWLVANPAIWSVTDWKVGEVESYSLYSHKGNKRRVFQNFLDAKVGDIVVCYEGSPVQKVTALASISKETDGNELWFKKEKSLETTITLTDIRDNSILSKMEFMVNPNGSLFKLTPDEYNTIMDLAGEDVQRSQQEHLRNYSKADFLNDVFVDEQDYERLVRLLLRKKNLILQGAPGVGKTYAAQRLAYSIMGVVDKSRVMQVQFHQNYSYEDFVMGYKPNKDGGFELKNGMFYKFCKKAVADRDRKYFFIIDEINRGNLSKIFGELLMLIENDYRNKPIHLSYNEELFSVPDNLYLIGMMNTADRSLAMIDYALRRRFSFFEMKPGFESRTFQQEITKKNDPVLEKLIKAIIELNIVIENDDSLGSGFCIGHSYLCNLDNDYNLENIVEYDIIPMLKEYWFDNNDRFNQEAQKLRDALK